MLKELFLAAAFSTASALSTGLLPSDVLMEELSQISSPVAIDHLDISGISHRLECLCLHEVGYRGDALSITPEQFRHLLQEIKAEGYTFIDANDLKLIKDGRMKQPKKAMFLSFDDGYADNYENAYPIIRQEGAKATFFLISSMIGQPGRMSSGQIQEMLDGGMAIGSHTVNHEMLDKITDEQVTTEMEQSKESLQEMFNEPIYAIAYPGGYEDKDVVNIASDVYEIGFIASMDKNVPNTPLTIHRHGVFRWNNSLSSIIGEKKKEAGIKNFIANFKK